MISDNFIHELITVLLLMGVDRTWWKTRQSLAEVIDCHGQRRRAPFEMRKTDWSNHRLVKEWHAQQVAEGGGVLPLLPAWLGGRVRGGWAMNAVISCSTCTSPAVGVEFVLVELQGLSIHPCSIPRFLV